MLPPEHEAWAVGDEDCVFIEFMRGTSDVYNYWPEHQQQPPTNLWWGNPGGVP